MVGPDSAAFRDAYAELTTFAAWFQGQSEAVNVPAGATDACCTQFRRDWTATKRLMGTWVATVDPAFATVTGNLGKDVTVTGALTTLGKRMEDLRKDPADADCRTEVKKQADRTVQAASSILQLVTGMSGRFTQFSAALVDTIAPAHALKGMLPLTIQFDAYVPPPFPPPAPSDFAAIARWRAAVEAGRKRASADSALLVQVTDLCDRADAATSGLGAFDSYWNGVVIATQSAIDALHRVDPTQVDAAGRAVGDATGAWAQAVALARDVGAST